MSKDKTYRSPVVVDAYSLADLIEQCQSQIQDGLVVDTETNENYPQQFGVRYLVTFVDPEYLAEFKQKNAEVVDQSTPKEVPEVKTAKVKVEKVKNTTHVSKEEVLEKVE